MAKFPNSIKFMFAAAGFALIASAAPSVAQDNGELSTNIFDVPLVDELRVGTYYANPDQAEQGALVQLEAVFGTFVAKDFGNRFVNAALRPRVHVGGNISVTGDTSVAYSGLTWNLPVYGPLFLEGTFGGGVHNGKLNNAGPNRQQLGCPVLFRESASIGLDFEKFRILGTIEHLSNAGLCTENDGLTNVGMRFSYKF